jgi:short-subunit dehydrogenase
MKKSGVSRFGVAAVPSRASLIDSSRFGPWALVTGASSGIGREFARQLAAHGLNLVIAARRAQELETLASTDLSCEHGVECRCVPIDLSKADAVDVLADATRDLDIGLVISNAGDAVAGEFLSAKREDMHAIARVNVLAHLDISHHFGRRLAARKRGGLVLVGALGASDGVPFMANPAATKAYVHSLGKALHIELAKHGVTVTVLMPGPTATPALEKLGIEDPPMKPMGVEQCVSETLRALDAGRSEIVPGRLIRLMSALVPASVVRDQTAKMFEAALKGKRSPASSPAAKTS